jgi:hypothetical protein
LFVVVLLSVVECFINRMALTPALRVVSAPNMMELGPAARARRRHRVPELLLAAAADAVRQDPRQGIFVFFCCVIVFNHSPFVFVRSIGLVGYIISNSCK